MRVAKFAMADIMARIIAQASSLPDFVAPCFTIGPSPWARTTAQMKKATPAAGATNAFTVNKWRILCTGNHRNGRDPIQKRKNETKSRVLVPDDADMLEDRFRSVKTHKA